MKIPGNLFREAPIKFSSILGRSRLVLFLVPFGLRCGQESRSIRVCEVLINPSGYFYWLGSS